MASRALAYVIKNSNTENFTLWKTGDMKTTFHNYQEKLQNKFGKNTGILAYMADIKNMYTELPHEEILKAIKFMLDRCKKKKHHEGNT